MQIVERGGPLLVIPKASRDVRAPGLHVSTIIHDLCQSIDPDRFKKDDPIDRLEWVGEELEEHPKIWLGSAVDSYFERVLDHHQGQTSFRPDSICIDDVWMSADRLAWEGPRPAMLRDNGVDPIVEEHKLTWMSLRHGIEHKKFWHWFVQLKAYCWAYETCRGRIRAIAINNDYAPPTPRPVVYDLLFTMPEIEGNWAMLKAHRALMRRQGRL